MSIQQMREKRAALVTEARNMHEKMPAKPSEAEVKAYDAKLDEIANLESSIKREQQILDMEAEAKFTDAVIDVKKGEVKRSKDPQAKRALEIFMKWLRGGDRAVSGEEIAEYRNLLPAGIRNTMSTTTGSEGGNTVETSIAARLIELLKEFGGMREVAEIIVTEQGNPLSFPTSDGTSEVGELVAENATAAAADPTFGTVSLNTFKYGSKSVAVPIELLQDSQINIEEFILRRLRDRLGRITNQHFTTGTGTAQPRGVVTGATAGVTLPVGNTTSYTYDGLVDLFHSVDPAYRKGVKSGFMTSDAGIKTLRKIKDSQNRPIFVPGYETLIPGASGSAPDQLLGAPLFVNNDVAAPAANARSIIYGDLSKYIIRDALGMVMQRFTDSAFALKGQVGFVAWLRAGGNLVDTTAVKALIHSAT